MHINNIGHYLSKKGAIITSLVTVFFIGIIIAIYLNSNNDHSFINFFQVTFSSIFYFKEYFQEDYIYMFIILVIAPITLFFSSIFLFIDKINKVKSQKYTQNVKSIDLLPDRINFNFYKKENNFVCGYDDIKSLNMIVHTYEQSSKGSTYIFISEIELIFTTVGDKVHKVFNTGGFTQMKFIYNVLRYQKYFSHFSYKVEGPDEGIKEKMNTFTKTGNIQIFTEKSFNNTKFISILVYCIGICLLFVFKEFIIATTKDGVGYILIIFPLIFLSISFINDFLLIKDIPNHHNNNLKKSIIKSISLKYLLISKIIVLFIILYYFFPSLLFGFTDNKISKAYELEKTPSVSLGLNELYEYNYMKKDEIYDLRKIYVKDSLFASKDYEPNQEVFGNITDMKPWWGLNQVICSEKDTQNYDTTQGVSALSRFINNPNILVGTFFGFNFYKEFDPLDYCTADYSRTIPVRMTYYKEKNLIVSEYKMDKRILRYQIRWNGNDRPYFLTLTGLNAKDLGFKYAFAVDTSNIQMAEKNNIATHVYEFRDYIHTGSSCRIEGGCNNISPAQPELDYFIKSLPAEMTIKLWKKQPLNPFVKANIYYKIVFTE